MRFQVPQFIETESKIIGPFTLKQFIYIGSAVGLAFMLRFLFVSLLYWVVTSIFLILLSFALAFYKIDGLPLPNYLVRAFSFLFGGKKYVFKKEEPANYESSLLDNGKK